MAKKTSPWIAHCKAFAKKHGINYPQAMAHPDCKATYKPVAKPAGKPAGKPATKRKSLKRKSSKKKKSKSRK